MGNAPRATAPVADPLSADALAHLYEDYLEADEGYLKDALLADYCARVDQLEVKYIGPTWQRGDGPGGWHLPELTLGWQVIGWISEFLRIPTKTGEPGKLTKEQVRFILWWYALNEQGEFIYRTGVLQRCKGWGKDPVAALLCIVEFVGPARFSHFDPDVAGGAVGEQVPEAWVQIAATAKDQTKNTATMFPALMTKHLISTYGIIAANEIWRADSGARRIEIVSSNAGTLQGNRSTFVLMNETHEWTPGRSGKALYETLDGNVTKVDGRWLAITNAFMPGQDSVAEDLRRDFQDVIDGIQLFDTGQLYDSIEADERAPMTPHAMRIILPKVRGDAWWLPVEGTIKSALAGSRAISKSRRMYYNQIVASEDALYTESQWVALRDTDLELRPGDRIVLGFDGSKTRDATALVAIRVSDNAAFLLHLQESQGDGWEVDRVKVGTAVHSAFRQFRVVGFYADVAEWQSYLDEWHQTYGERLLVKANASGSAIAWDMRQGGGKVTWAHERLFDSIKEGKLRHNGDVQLQRHVLAARIRENSYGVTFGKETEGSSIHKIDAYAALLLAHEALHDFRTKAREAPTKSGAVWFM